MKQHTGEGRGVTQKRAGCLRGGGGGLSNLLYGSPTFAVNIGLLNVVFVYIKA